MPGQTHVVLMFWRYTYPDYKSIAPRKVNVPMRYTSVHIYK